MTEKTKEYYREYQRKNYAKYRERYKEYYKEYRKKYYQEHKEEEKEYFKQWRKNNREKYNKICAKCRKKRAYKLIQEGVINPYTVINNKGEPKYETEVNKEE
jgi:hypothetical protein